MRTVTGWGLVALTLSSFAASGCSSPPTVEIEAADAALAAALTAGAEEYAPASIGAVRDLRSQLDAELAIQADKFALTRSYDHATELATQISAAAESSAVEAGRYKEEVRQETAVLLEEVRVALTEAQGMLARAPRGKGSAVDLAAMRVDLDSAAATLAAGEVAMSEGRYLEAQAKVLAVQSSAQAVKSAIEAARRARGGA